MALVASRIPQVWVHFFINQNIISICFCSPKAEGTVQSEATAANRSQEASGWGTQGKELNSISECSTSAGETPSFHPLGGPLTESPAAWISVLFSGACSSNRSSGDHSPRMGSRFFNSRWEDIRFWSIPTNILQGHPVGHGGN